MEQPLSETTHLLIGKTIAKMDTTSCNNIEFLFTDGTKVALHIEMDGMFSVPFVTTCTECCMIE
jgi:hypothetical protein